MGRATFQLAGVLLIVGFLAALHTIGLRASTLGLSLAAVATAALAVGPVRFDRGPVGVLVAALCAWVILVAAPRLGVWETAFQLSVFLLLPLSYIASRRLTDEAFRALLGSLVLVLSALGVAALWYGAMGETSSPIFPNRNNQAAMLNIGALLATGMALAPVERRAHAFWLMLAVFVMTAGSLLAGSRGAMLGLATGLVVSAVGERHSLRRWMRRCLAPVAAGWAVAAAVGAGWVVDRAATLASPEIAQNVRLGQWTSALQVIGDAPLFGHGLGLTHWVWASVLVPDTSLGVYPHNDYLQYALESGIPAALLVAALLATVVLLPVMRSRPGADSHLAVGAAAAVAALAVHAGVSYHLQIAPHLLMLGVLTAAVARGTATQSAYNWAPGWARRTVLGVLLLQGFLLAAYGLAMPHHRIPLNLAMQTHLEYANAPSATEMQRLSIAARLQPHATEARLALASAYWARCRNAGAADDCAHARMLAETAARRNPVSYEAVFLRGKYSGALADVLQAIEMNPRLTVARIAAADMLDARGDREAAFAVLHQGLRYLRRPKTSDIGYLARTEAAAVSLGRNDVVAEVARIRDRIGRRLPPD